MAQQNTAAKAETLEERLARVLAENEALKKQAAANEAEAQRKAGEFGLAVTVERAPGTRGKDDKGSKGGTLAVSLGKQHVYPSKLMVMAIIDHADEIKAFIKENATKITR
jgi:hypothetical protein